MNPTRHPRQREWPGNHRSRRQRQSLREDYDFLGSPPIIHIDTRSKYGPVTLKYQTSKLTGFDDLAGIETYGFRGEAPPSLCALSESITVTIATSEGAPMTTALEFDRMAEFSIVPARSLNRWDHSAHRFRPTDEVTSAGLRSCCEVCSLPSCSSETVRAARKTRAWPCVDTHQRICTCTLLTREWWSQTHAYTSV